MKLTKNKTKQIVVRVTQKQYDYFNYVAFKSGCTPSQLFRMLVNNCNIEVEKMLKEGTITYEDIETIKHS